MKTKTDKRATAERSPRHIAAQSEDFNQWYTDVVTKGDLADYSPIKGCMVIKPYGYALWENIQRVLDGMIKETGHQNAYFPLFIPESFLKKEKEHVEGFSPELAVVTIAGGKELEEPLVVRPTSETIIYSMFAKWVHSYRDLPLLINQWANVVRWEKRTRLFLRTTEFLWQEGHTAHTTFDEAQGETLKMLGIYKKFAEEFLALPVIDGQKSESEKFAGAYATYSLEAMMKDNKALQSATSHNLGQNFAKAFGITFLDRDNLEQHVWQTSWGLSTRIIGAIIMTHGDERGLIMPPRIAPLQVVIVPIFSDEQKNVAILDAAQEIARDLAARDISAQIDDRTQETPGFKFNEWELKGVPMRIEIGARDMAQHAVTLVRRDTGKKESVAHNKAVAEVVALLQDIQRNLFTAAKERMEQHIFPVQSFAELKESMAEPKGFAVGGWCGSAVCEAAMKEKTGATIRNIPFHHYGTFTHCVGCGKKAAHTAIFAKAY